MASVKPGTPPIPVQVKFALREHPQASQPAEIDLAIIPASAALDRVFGKIQGEEGLTVVDGEDVPETLKPTDTVPIHHRFKVEAKQDGIYELTVSVSVDSAGLLSTQSYSIPVIIGNGMADLPAPGTTAPQAAAKPRPPPGGRQPLEPRGSQPAVPFRPAPKPGGFTRCTDPGRMIWIGFSYLRYVKDHPSAQFPIRPTPTLAPRRRR